MRCSCATYSSSVLIQTCSSSLTDQALLFERAGSWGCRRRWIYCRLTAQEKRERETEREREREERKDRISRCPLQLHVTVWIGMCQTESDAGDCIIRKRSSAGFADIVNRG